MADNDNLLHLHSPIDILGKFVSLFQSRFSSGKLPWVWSADENTSSLFVISEFSVPKDFEDMSPAVVVTRGTVAHNRDVVGDTDQNNMQFITKRGKNYWSTGNCDLRIECVGQTKGEATSIADIVATTIHMTRDPICEAFALRDISPVVLGRTVEYERDARKWVCPVDFRISFEERWFVIPGAPSLRKIEFTANGTTMELEKFPAPPEEDAPDSETTIVATAPAQLTISPSTILSTDDLVFLHSPINLLGQFVGLMRHRFALGSLPWQYFEDENKTEIFIESEFSISSDIEDVSPEIVVARGSTVHKRTVVGDTDQNNMQYITKRGKNYWSTGEADIRIQCIGQTKGEAALLGDIVQTTIHMTRDPICEAFTLRDISPVVMSKVVEYERDARKWICTVDFRVDFEQRWFSIPEAPQLRQILLRGITTLSDIPPPSGEKTVTKTSSLSPTKTVTSDKLVKISSSDTLAQFLSEKLIAGSNITTDLLTDANGVQSLQLSATGGGGGTSDPVDVSARDSTNEDIIYIGRSSASDGNENTAAPEWQIYRYDSAAVLITVEYADGNLNFDNVWDDRESLSYAVV